MTISYIHGSRVLFSTGGEREEEDEEEVEKHMKMKVNSGGRGKRA